MLVLKLVFILVVVPHDIYIGVMNGKHGTIIGADIYTSAIGETDAVNNNAVLHLRR